MFTLRRFVYAPVLALAACAAPHGSGIIPQSNAGQSLAPLAHRPHFGDVSTISSSGGFGALAWDADDGLLVGTPAYASSYSSPTVVVGSQGKFVFPKQVSAVAYDSKSRAFYFAYQNQLFSSDVKGRLKTVTTAMGNATALAVDPAGNVYAIDGDHVVRIRDGKVSIYSNPGTVTTDSGQINAKASLAFDTANKSLYISDPYGDVVKRILSSGQADVVAGHCVKGGGGSSSCAAGATEGRGKAAWFGSPSGLVYDAHRDVFVMADSTNNQLWEVRSNGQAKIVAGYGPANKVDGNGWRAFFAAPSAMAYAKDRGQIFVSDARLSSYSVTGDRPAPVDQPTVRFAFSNPYANMGFPTASGADAWFIVQGRVAHIAPSGAIHSFQPAAERLGGFGQIAIDAQQNLWMVVESGIVSMTPQGVFHRFNLPKSPANTNSPIIGPDGHPWFADEDFTAPAIATVVNGKVVAYSLGSGFSAPRPGWLMSGPDGTIWFTTSAHQINRMSTAGKLLSPIKIKTQIPPGQMVYNAKSGDVWFLDSAAENTAYRMTPDHKVHTYSLKCGCGEGSTNITVTPDDTAYIAMNNGGAIAGVTPDGELHGYYMPYHTSGVYGIAASSNTSLWVTTLAGQVFLFDPAQYATAGLPPNPLVGGGSY